jgi:hypothetical protein
MKGEFLMENTQRDNDRRRRINDNNDTDLEENNREKRQAQDPGLNQETETVKDEVNPGGVRPPESGGGEVDFTPVDSYTGEPHPPETEGDIPMDDIQVEHFANESEILPLDQDTAMDFLLIDSAADIDPVMDDMDDFTMDEDVLDDFRERQAMTGGSEELLLDLLEHNAQGPQLSGGDIDAAWDSSIVSGEESVGGTVSTPDQDVVDELGEAVGITYDDDEELNTEEKLGQRDRARWELDPRSADEEEEDLNTSDPSREKNEDLDDF